MPPRSAERCRVSQSGPSDLDHSRILISTFESASESRLEIEVEPPLLAWVEAARDVEAEDSIEHRFSIADPAQGAADFLQAIAIAGPPKIPKESRTVAGIVPRQLETSQPKGV